MQIPSKRKKHKPTTNSFQQSQTHVTWQERKFALTADDRKARLSNTKTQEVAHWYGLEIALEYNLHQSTNKLQSNKGNSNAEGNKHFSVFVLSNNPNSPISEEPPLRKYCHKN